MNIIHSWQDIRIRKMNYEQIKEQTTKFVVAQNNLHLPYSASISYLILHRIKAFYFDINASLTVT